jgi:hypothetical protein
MAGEWLKMECATPDKPEVFAITAKMGWDDPDLTVGKLFRVWRWFDQQTTNGNAHGVTTSLLDRIASATGFAQAMIEVGWLTVSDSGLELPNFEKHNGATAKSRAQTAKRVANHRALDGCNGATVTGALAREEKRREEKSKPKSKAETATASRLPADWTPSDSDLKFCAVERPDLDCSAVAARFSDYWRSLPGAKGKKLDWSATWRNWVRNENAKSGATHGKNGSSRAGGIANTLAELTGRNRHSAPAITGTAMRVD